MHVNSDIATLTSELWYKCDVELATTAVCVRIHLVALAQSLLQTLSQSHKGHAPNPELLQTHLM